VNRGEIHLCDFGDPIGSEQGFQRPAVIVSASALSRYGLPIVLPMTRTKLGYATHIEIEGALPVTSYVQCEQIRVVSAERLLRRVGSLDGVDMVRVENVLRRILEL
jgi:mRNA interferase MazF